MPASWLVTRPPRPSSKNVANTVSTANQCNHGLVLIDASAFISKIKSPRRGRSGSCLSLKKSFRFEGEIHGCVAVLDFHFLRLRAEFAVRSLHGVFARRHILDDEFAVLVADTKVR